ncbi:MAG: hypothetical protein QXS54_10440 [Candidatus Methanomethylicaceae archaeon]
MADYATLGAKLLKNIYDRERMQYLVAEHFALEKLFSKFSGVPRADVGGLKWVFPVGLRWPNSVTFMPYNGVIRTPDSFDMVQGEVTVRQLTATASIQYAMQKLSEGGGVRAFADALQEERRVLALRIRDRRLRAYFAGQNGIMAVVTDVDSAENKIKVMSPYGFTNGAGGHTIGAAYLFRHGDKIVLHDDVNYVGTGHLTVVDIDTEDNWLTVQGTIPGTGVVGSYVVYGEYRADLGQFVSDWGQSMNGLYDIFTAETYEGISSVQVPQWRATVFHNEGILRPLDGDILIDLLGAAEAKGIKLDTILVHSSAKKAFYNMFADQVRYEPGQFKGGMQSVTFDLLGHSAQIWFDQLAPKNWIIGFRAQDLIRFELDPGDWLREGDSELKWVKDKTEWVLVWAELRNVGTRRRDLFFAVGDIEM